MCKLLSLAFLVIFTIIALFFVDLISAELLRVPLNHLIELMVLPYR